jgi:hypothetical protein
MGGLSRQSDRVSFNYFSGRTTPCDVVASFMSIFRLLVLFFDRFRDLEFAAEFDKQKRHGANRGVFA